MAQSPKPGKCVHCLRTPVDRNWDHVFPESWYPETTPTNLAKWKIPSCIRCNRELGAIESEFFVRIALCLDPKSPAFKGLSEKALRAMNPRFATSAADKRAREALARRIEAELLEGEKIPSEGIFPALGERWGRPHESGIAIVISAESFRRITEKIVRGMTYLEQGKFIESLYQIQFFALDDEGAKPVKDMLDSVGTVLAREPGIVVRRAVIPEDGVSALYESYFWQQFKTYASVLIDDA